MISTWAILVACLTVAAALSKTAPASDVQRVVSHLQALMPLHAASVSERFKRQVQNESGTSGDQPPPPPPPPPPPHMYHKCCKKMPKIVNMKTVRECSKSFRRPAPPQENPGGPPPPAGSTSGPPPTGSTSGPPPSTSTSASPPSTSPSAPPPPTRGGTPPPPQGAPPPGEKGEEFGEKDVGEPVETLGDAQNSSTSGKMQHRPGGRGCKCGRHARRERMACAMECAFKKENLIKDGVVDQKAFAAYADKYIQEKKATVWKDAIDAALKNCSVSVPASIKQDSNCTSGSIEMVQCMDRQIFEHCPDSNWKSGNAKCDACRAAPQNCLPKKGRRKPPQQSPRNETQVQA